MYLQKTIQMAANTSYTIALGGSFGYLELDAKKACWVQAVGQDTAPADLAGGDVPAAAGENKDVMQLDDGQIKRLGVESSRGYQADSHADRFTHLRVRCGANAGNLSIIAH